MSKEIVELLLEYIDKRCLIINPNLHYSFEHFKKSADELTVIKIRIREKL